MVKLRQIQRGEDGNRLFLPPFLQVRVRSAIVFVWLRASREDRDAKSPAASGSRSAPRRASCRSSSKMPPDSDLFIAAEKPLSCRLILLPSCDARGAHLQDRVILPCPPPPRVHLCGKGRGSHSSSRWRRRWSIDSKASGGREGGREGERVRYWRRAAPPFAFDSSFPSSSSFSSSAAAVCDFNAISGQWRRRGRGFTSPPRDTAVGSICASQPCSFIPYPCS